jgi:hypothetical protein
VRALIYQGFKKQITGDSLLSQFPVNKAILKAICSYLKIEYNAVKSHMKNILDGQPGYADDLVLAILDIFFLKVNGGVDPFLHPTQNGSTPMPAAQSPEKSIHIGDSSGVKWSALLKDHHSVKFNYTLIKDESLENHKLEIRIVYKIYTDKYLTGYELESKAS